MSTATAPPTILDRTGDDPLSDRAAARDERRLRGVRGTLVALAIWAAARIVLEGAAVIAWLVERPGQLRLTTFPTVLHHWDSERFAHVAQFGYRTFGQVPYEEAFLPGYPFLSRFVAEGLFFTVTPNPTQIAAAMWLVTGVGAAVAAVLLWKTVRDRFDPVVAAGAVAILVAGPYAHFLVAPYAGSPYLALAIGAWLLVQRGRWLTGALLCAVAGAIRVETVYLVAALVVAQLIGPRVRPFASRLWRAVVFGAIGSLGLTYYLAWLWHKTGDPTHWFLVQKLGWKRETLWPWETFQNTLRIATGTTGSGQFQEWSDIVMVAVYVVAVGFLVAKRWWPELVYTGLMLVSMGTSHAWTSMARESSVQFPLMILVATTLRGRRSRWVFWVVLGIGIVDATYQSYRFALGDWGD
ncbi:mannosyltransferase family protein [Curtobacterium caseinilyticum]|uniref:Mannosyltransferase family protein n=1 Tax=Curtobacterium caseinilyticum TaxID=3055137 RepID=A0ABT7TMB2_9MICO|nr:mannosyltransferase family protein [Curtobacterium caseinilyticum]MDM7890728.1 mannosyltransferase family protein [Curtobacterium caseinilyticum]